MRLGFVGLGNMGGPMAMNLIRAGHKLVVHDIDPAATAPHREQGATWAGSPAEVARACDVVFTSLPGPAQVEEVALGKDGLIEGLAPGAVFVELSTGSPSTIRKVAERVEAAGAHMVDAPVSGGTTGARAGTLAVMVGGERAVYERVKPLLEVIGGGVSYIGAIGTGTVAKLVHNAISMTARIALQEGFALAAKGGVEPAEMLEVLRNSSFGKGNLLSTNIPDRVFKANYDPPSFSLRLSHKDAMLALELASELDAPMTLAALANEELERGLERGWGERDCMVTFLLAEERTGTKIRG
jgi:3-hydroxyisobutyrate dehydrogenase